MIWNMEPGTNGVTGPWVMSRETMRCQEEKLPAVVRAWLSSLCRASLTSFGPMVAALGGTQEQSPDWPKTPCRKPISRPIGPCPLFGAIAAKKRG